ncbi:leptin-like [Pungitius pungitius]|uniref:leptin-like n=1 Tax=Pungitius pungitius TaxID=134920 RepID=UPI001888EC1B|nr:leptin-like [Pungitius pungitius]
MAYTFALLVSLLHFSSMCSAFPLPEEIVKSKVILKAKQLVVKLNRFEFPDDLPTGAPADNLSGTSSIVATLEEYNSLISDSLEGVEQVKVELSSLIDSLCQLGQGHCGEEPKPTQSSQSQRFKEYVTLEKLLRIKERLNQLLENVDILDTY